MWGKKGERAESDGGVHAYDITRTGALVEGQSRRRQQVIRHEGERDGWRGGDCRREGEAQKYKQRSTST